MRASAVAGIIFANSNDQLLNKLTGIRSMASVPFGGRYRLIDFSLSNLVNAGVSNVGIITKENYRSLMDHIGSGASWDLDRKKGGIHILPPYYTSGARRYHGYVEALYGAVDFMKRSNAEYIVLCESNVVANVDIDAVVNKHIENNADITIVYSYGKCPKDHPNTMLLTMDETEHVTGVEFSENRAEELNFGIGTLVANRDLLIKLISDGYENGCTRISRDIIAPNISEIKLYGYKHDGFVAVMDCESTYFESNMKLLDPKVRSELFKTRPIYTKTRDDMPTRYGTKADVHNCFIADGCVINGTVINSVLFRGVTVEKGAVIENSILMQSVKVGSGTHLDYVVSDKNAVIGDNITLKGNKEKPLTVSKNRIV